MVDTERGLALFDAVSRKVSTGRSGATQEQDSPTSERTAARTPSVKSRFSRH